MTGFFLKRPRTAVLACLGLFLLGVMAALDMPVAEMPNIDYPSIVVSASLPGADPEIMAASAASPLEAQLTAIPGLTAMNSINSRGQTAVVLRFEIGKSMDQAAADVQNAINAAQPFLPSNLPSPPTFKKVNPADPPILFIRLINPEQTLYAITDVAKTRVAGQIAMLPGVSQALVLGDQTYAPRVRLDPGKLAALRVGLDEIAQAVAEETVALPLGTFSDANRQYVLRADGQLTRAEAYADQILLVRNGRPIRLRDVGCAVNDVRNNRYASLLNGHPGVTVAVKRAPGANSLEVIGRALALVEELRPHLPPAMEVEILYDRSETVRASFREALLTAVFSAVLVLAAVLAFLGDRRAGLAAALTLPVPLVGALALVRPLGVSLNVLSLTALVLATLFVADDAVVMIEHLAGSGGAGPKADRRDDLERVGRTVLAMTASVAALLLPIPLLPGVLGRILSDMALTALAATLLSGFTVLSLTPVLCRRRNPDQASRGGRVFCGLQARYAQSLEWAVKRPWLVLTLFCLLLPAGFVLARSTPTGFVPATDSGLLLGAAQAEPGVSFEAMRRRCLGLTERLRADPNVDKVVCVVGEGGPNATANNASVTVFLKPARERTASFQEVVAGVKARGATCPDLKTFFYAPPAIRIGAKSDRAFYQLTLLSADVPKLRRAAADLERAMRRLPELADVNSDMEADGPQVLVEVDRDRAASLGVSARNVETALMSAYAAREVTNLYGTADVYKVIVEVAPQFQTDPGLLSRLYLRSRFLDPATGLPAMVPLAGVARLTEGVGPMVVNHFGRMPAVTLSFNLAEGRSLGQAAELLEELAASIPPDGVFHAFEGQARAFREAEAAAPILLGLAVMVIYLVLGTRYESFVSPLVVLAGLPLAVVGGLGAVVLCGRVLDVYGFVGLLLLAGLAVKNAIMMLDRILAARERGLDATAAAVAGAASRLRPILMTTAVALAGILPLALGIGTGEDSRRTLGVATVGGLCFSLVVSLYLTPVLAAVLDVGRRSRRKRVGRAP